MTIQQPSLFEDGQPANWRAQLEQLLTHTLHFVRRGFDDGRALSDQELDDALSLVRQIVDELKIINSADDVPF